MMRWQQRAGPSVHALRPAYRWGNSVGRLVRQGALVKEVERSLSPRKFHFRLPFFARVLADDKVSIDGNCRASWKRRSPTPRTPV